MADAPSTSDPKARAETTPSDPPPPNPRPGDETWSPSESAKTPAQEKLQQGKKIGKQAFDTARSATGDAWAALRTLIGDPLGSQKKALHQLGAKRAFSAGIVFMAAFVLAAMISAALWSGAYSLGVAPRRAWLVEPGFLDYVKTALVLSALPGGLLLGYWGVGRLFGGKSSVPEAVFVSGMAVLPLAAAMVAARLTVQGAAWLASGAMTFGGVLFVLILHSAVLHVQPLHPRRAVWATPTMVLAMFLVMQVVGGLVT